MACFLWFTDRARRIPLCFCIGQRDCMLGLFKIAAAGTMVLIPCIGNVYGACFVFRFCGLCFLWFLCSLLLFFLRFLRCLRRSFRHGRGWL